MAINSFLKSEALSVTLIPFFDFPLRSGQPYGTVRTTPMLILLVEEVGEGAPAKKGAALPAATHSAGHTQTASLHVSRLVETSAAGSAPCLPAPS